MNAVYRMARLLPRNRGVCGEACEPCPADPVLGPRTLSVGRIAGGVSPNTVPDCCSADLDRRLLPGETYESATADLEAFLRELPGVDFPFTLTSSSPGCLPLGPELSVDLVRRFGSAIDSVVGTHRVHSVPFGTDASTVAAAGIPAVVFGPGDIAQAHTKDEWIELASARTGRGDPLPVRVRVVTIASRASYTDSVLPTPCTCGDSREHRSSRHGRGQQVR